MAKKHTSVALPGGLAGLAHAAQQHTQPTTQAASAPRDIHDQADEPEAPQAADDWERFIDEARRYHRAADIEGVYIDRKLKRTLSRLRVATGVSTAALLSAIVARFLDEHADEVERATSL